MGECQCKIYSDIEFDRSQITKRSKDSPIIKRALTLRASLDDAEHKLYECPQCNQLWQRAFAWNWGQVEYLFKVPETSMEDWLLQRYVDPDELFIWQYAVMKFTEDGNFTPQSKACSDPNCDYHAITMSRYCLIHHVESLQQHGTLPPTPEGRWFAPYLSRSPEQFAEYIQWHQARLQDQRPLTG